MATVSRATRVKVPTSAKDGQKWGTQDSHGVRKVKFPTLSQKTRQGWGNPSEERKNEPGRFGVYGGRYVPETLMAALEELEREYEKAKRDPSFQRAIGRIAADLCRASDAAVFCAAAD